MKVLTENVITQNDMKFKDVFIICLIFKSLNHPLFKVIIIQTFKKLILITTYILEILKKKLAY